MILRFTVTGYSTLQIIGNWKVYNSRLKMMQISFFINTIFNEIIFFVSLIPKMVYFLSVLWHDAKIVGIDKNGLWVCFNYLYCWYQFTFSWSFFFGDKMKKCEQTGLFNKCFWFCFKIFLYCIYEAVGWIMMVNVSYSVLIRLVYDAYNKLLIKQE